MVTDPARERRTDPGNPDDLPGVHVPQSFPRRAEPERDGRPRAAARAGIGCIECKNLLLKHLEPIL